MATRVYVGNLPYSASDEQLRELFQVYGEVTEAAVMRDRSSGLSKGFGFVQMPDAEAAHQAILSLNGTMMSGRTIHVNEAEERAPKREFAERPPRREYEERPPKREYGERPPRREYGERPQRREYGERPPRREYGEHPPRRERQGFGERGDAGERGRRPRRDERHYRSFTDATSFDEDDNE